MAPTLHGLRSMGEGRSIFRQGHLLASQVTKGTSPASAPGPRCLSWLPGSGPEEEQWGGDRVMLEPWASQEGQASLHLLPKQPSQKGICGVGPRRDWYGCPLPPLAPPSSSLFTTAACQSAEQWLEAAATWPHLGSPVQQSGGGSVGAGQCLGICMALMVSLWVRPLHETLLSDGLSTTRARRAGGRVEWQELLCFHTSRSLPSKSLKATGFRGRAVDSTGVVAGAGLGGVKGVGLALVQTPTGQQ